MPLLIRAATLRRAAVAVPSVIFHRPPPLPRISHRSPILSASFRPSLFHPPRPNRRLNFSTTPPNSQFSSRYHRAQSFRSSFVTFFRRWSSRPTFYLEVSGISLFFSGFYVSNLEAVPISGRRRFNVISVDWERQLGEQQYHEILGQFKNSILPDYDPRVIQVRRVLDRLIPNSGLPSDYSWSVTVIDSPETNAFVIPGGKVFVFTGILPVCGNDDGLAAVLGHEIGHNVARHVAEQMSRGIVLVAAAWLIEIFYGIPGGISQSLLGLAIDRPRSRAQESEADYIGLMMMSKSCYNPQAAVTLWERMQVVEQKQGTPPEILSTHPSSKRRQEQLTELMPKALDLAADSGCGQVHQYCWFLPLSSLLMEV